VAVAQDAPQPPAVPLAELYAAQIDPAPYWVSEKLDGVRAVWDGRTLRFRSGETIRAPAWFLAGLPATPLDGELWIGRGTFDRLSGIVRKREPVDAEWRELRYMIFELPGAPGRFSERVARMRDLVAAADVAWLDMVAQERVSDRAALARLFERVLRAGGEGLMLHRADAPWVTGRSPALLKMKPWLDAEARVVAWVGGRGKYRGMLGALEVETPAGRRFRIGTGFTDAQRRAPPPVGATVTYRYRALTATGLPRFARFVRVRELP
jgi:DNA ligase-1